MKNTQIHVEMQSNARSFQEVNAEIGQLKMVIGFILAKLPPEARQDVVNELNNWGFPKTAEEFDQFVNPRSPR